MPKRWYDKGCCCCKRKPNDKFKTNLLDQFDYVDVHAGPKFNLHALYAKFLLIIYVTLTFGFLLPILFPICAFALTNLYITDALLLTYWYRRPPDYDDAEYRNALYILKFAPIPMFAFGYWAMSNE